jgi:hypothetical protein
VEWRDPGKGNHGYPISYHKAAMPYTRYLPAGLFKTNDRIHLQNLSCDHHQMKWETKNELAGTIFYAGACLNRIPD